VTGSQLPTPNIGALSRLLAQALTEEKNARNWLECCRLMCAGERFAERRLSAATDRVMGLQHRIELEHLRAELEQRRNRFVSHFGSQA
jgi:hypothetical protein